MWLHLNDFWMTYQCHGDKMYSLQNRNTFKYYPILVVYPQSDYTHYGGPFLREHQGPLEDFYSPRLLYHIENKSKLE